MTRRYKEAAWDDNKSAFDSRHWGCAFGLDPELFIMSRKAKQKAISAHISGITFDPPKKSAVGYGGLTDIRFKPDGWAFEVNTGGGSSCRDSTIPAMAQRFRQFYDAYPNLKLSAIPVMRLNAESLRDAPDDVTGYGCVPDRNAYELAEKSPPTDGYKDDFRYAGGHIHISGVSHGYDANMACALYALLGDVFVGLPMVAVIGNTNDYGEERRRSYYGTAGSYRVKEYPNRKSYFNSETGKYEYRETGIPGFEYRVLSSAIMMSPIMLSYAIGLLRSTLHVFQPQWKNAVMSEEALVDFVTALDKQYDFVRVRSIIDHHDVTEARAFVADKLADHDKWYMRPFYELMVKADDNQVPLIPDFYKAWDLGRKQITSHAYLGVESATAKLAFATGDFFPQGKFAPGRAWAFGESKELV